MVRQRIGRFNQEIAAVACGVSVVLTLACGDDDPPADVAGEYTVNVTNGEGPCLSNWQQGASFTNIGLDLIQDGSSVQGTFSGVLATVFLQSVIGSTVFQGRVSGRTIEMTRLGTQTMTSGACNFTVRADLEATSDGDLIEGRIVYTPVTDDDPNCAGIVSCRAIQTFNGTRPPQ